MDERYNPQEQETLLSLARASIRLGLEQGSALVPELKDLPQALLRDRACFVTLRQGHELRGCIGSLSARRALAVEACAMAFEAAFHDPRFPALDEDGYKTLRLHISVLSPLSPIDFEGQEGLLQALVPGSDGVLLECGNRRGFFLPSVWDELPDPAEFLGHLKLKAGLNWGHWEPKIRASRCRAFSIEEP